RICTIVATTRFCRRRRLPMIRRSVAICHEIRPDFKKTVPFAADYVLIIDTIGPITYNDGRCSSFPGSAWERTNAGLRLAWADFRATREAEPRGRAFPGRAWERVGSRSHGRGRGLQGRNRPQK